MPGPVAGPLRADGRFLKDAHGRVVLLRGLNLGGDSKVPYPRGGTQFPSDFADHRDVSFVGRPFPIDEADLHLGRIRDWGFGALRLVTTWEAVAPGGPGRFDGRYLDHLRAVCEAAGRYDLHVVVDFHQDAFSRLSGGDGAPGWVLEALGIDLSAIAASGAAHVMQAAYDYADPRALQPERYAPMSWVGNYGLGLNGIAWALFFAGRAVVPQFLVNGQDVQSFLQGHFLAAVDAVAARLVDLPHVIGFDALNEPSAGFLGRRFDERRLDDGAAHPCLPGPALSPLDAVLAAEGLPTKVPVLEPSLWRRRLVPKGEITLNPQGRRLWQPGRRDPFWDAGIWRLEPGSKGGQPGLPGGRGRPIVLQPEALARPGGRDFDFERDALVPFLHDVARTVRRHRADWLLFAEKDALAATGDPTLPEGLPDGTVNAGHWYDATLLVLKRSLLPLGFDQAERRFVWGERGLGRSYARQLERLARGAGARPTLVGELGVPMDLNGGRAYRQFARLGPPAFAEQARFLGLVYDALDAHLLHSTQWNYTAGNQNDPRVGDQWNQEDFSVYSRDQETSPDDPYSGGRGLAGCVRPYARAIQGVPESMRFARRRGGGLGAREFVLRWRPAAEITAPTEIVVPRLQYPDGFRVEARGCEVLETVAGVSSLVRARGPGPGIAEIRVFPGSG